MSDMIKTDICVIGAGSGGLSVAAGAAQMGARVVLIEKAEMGGDCLNTGCVPSKALLHAGKAGMDWDAAHQHVRSAIETIAPHDSVERFEGLGVRVIQGSARFTSKREVIVGEQVIRARRFVVATGSRPLIPDVTGLKEAEPLTNETIFDLKDRPDHLLIIGGGPIGMEMAVAHRQLGCSVTVLEGSRALGREDQEAAKVVLDSARDMGIKIVEDAQAVRITKSNGEIEIVTQDGGVFTGTHLLVAVGRRAVVEELGLEVAGVALERGAIKVDAGLRTTNKRILAIGDVAGQGQFTHLAGYQAGVITRRLLFALPAKAKSSHIPRATYTTPELAHIGLSEEDARREYGGRIEVVRFDVSGLDRAITSGETRGFAKVVVLGGKPIGATIVSADAGEQIGIWSLMINQGLKMSALAGMVVPYPVRAELPKRVAGAYFSPRLFESDKVKRFVRLVQKLVP
ncbi:MAG: dihydrolipoyl dehydrogenase family protein [Maritimibacter sp.]